MTFGQSGHICRRSRIASGQGYKFKELDDDTNGGLKQSSEKDIVDCGAIETWL